MSELVARGEGSSHKRRRLPRGIVPAGCLSRPSRQPECVGSRHLQALTRSDILRWRRQLGCQPLHLPSPNGGARARLALWWGAFPFLRRQRSCHGRHSGWDSTPTAPLRPDLNLHHYRQSTPPSKLWRPQCFGSATPSLVLPLLLAPSSMDRLPLNTLIDCTAILIQPIVPLLLTSPPVGGLAVRPVGGLCAGGLPALWLGDRLSLTAFARWQMTSIYDPVHHLAISVYGSNVLYVVACCTGFPLIPICLRVSRSNRRL